MPFADIKTIDELDKILTQKDGSTVVYFCATWSKLCTELSPNFETFSKIKAATTFCKVDVDAVKGAMDRIEVGGVPAFMLYKNGTKMRQVPATEASVATLSGLVAQA